jgi:hypothetical protein
MSTYPEEGEVYQGVADMLSGATFWELAWFSAYKATILEPENEPFQYLLWDVAKEHLRKVGNGNEWINTDNLYAQVRTNMDYFQFLTPTVYLNVFAERNHITSKSLLDVEEGVFLPFDVERYRSFLTLGKKLTTCLDLEASLYNNEVVFGGGIALKYKGPNIAAVAELEYHKPDWQYVELAIAKGTRDRVGGLCLYQATPFVSFLGGAALNRYNSKNISSIATTYSVDLAVTIMPIAPYLLRQWFCAESFFSLNYIFNGEFEMTSKEVLNQLLELYNPLSPGERALHNFFFLFNQKYFRKFFWEGFFGFGFDGSSKSTAAPIYGVSTIVNGEGRISGGVVYAHEANNDIGGGSVDTFKLAFKVIF